MASQLVGFLAARLVRDHGGSGARWRRLLGRVHLYDLKTHPHCNWAINPTGSKSEISIIEQLLDEFRMSHPIVQGD